MKLSLASSFLILTLSISTSTADDESFRPRHRRTKGGKGNKAGKEHQQCEMIEVIVNSAPPCSLVNPDPFDENNRETNAIGSTNFETIYDAPIGDFDGSITSPPVGIRFVSGQTEPQTNKVATPYPDNVENPYYSLAAGFLLDPTTNDIGLNDTLYESSIYYQEYKYYNDFDLDGDEQIVRFPIVGGTGRYACASGEIVRSDVYYFEGVGGCSYRSYKLRVCNTCPDPNVAKWH